jgi:PTS system mannose-specific IIB component
MTIGLFRVDDRLIHGQVVVGWQRRVNASVILVIDDETAADEFLAEILTLAVPAGVTGEVLSTEDGARRLTELAAADQAAIVLVRSPLTALAVHELGAPLEVLNIGGIGAGPGRTPFYRNISASPDEIAALHALAEAGVRVEVQIVPDDKATPLAAVSTR